MTSRANHLPTSILLNRPHGALQRRQGAAPKPERGSAEQAAVGRAFEEMLLREMVKAMQKTVPKSGTLPDGPSKGLYEHMMQQALVENLSGQGGLGIADALQRSQNTLRRSGVGVAPTPRVAPHDAQTGRATASNDKVESSISTTDTPDLSSQLPNQDDSWIDSPFAADRLRRLLSDETDRKNSPFPFKK
jgi:Rod binding domain-containing protein